MKIATDPVEVPADALRTPRLPDEQDVAVVPIGVALVDQQSTTPVFIRALSDALVVPPCPDQVSRSSRAGQLLPAVGRVGNAESAHERTATIVAFVEGSQSLPDVRGWSQALPSGAPGAIVAHVVAGRLVDRNGQAHTGGQDGQRAGAKVVVQLRDHGPLVTSADVILRHPALGRIDLSVQVSERRVCVTVQAATPTARRVLSEAEADLRAALAEQGFELQQWNVPSGRGRRAKHAGSRVRHLDLEV